MVYQSDRTPKTQINLYIGLRLLYSSIYHWLTKIPIRLRERKRSLTRVYAATYAVKALVLHYVMYVIDGNIVRGNELLKHAITIIKVMSFYYCHNNHNKQTFEVSEPHL